MGASPRARHDAGRSGPLPPPPVPPAPASLSSEAGWTRARKLALAMLVGYVAAMAAVCLLLRTPWLVARGNETTGDRAIFTAVNAATLTGFQQTMSLREMRQVGMAGPSVMLALTLVGSITSLMIGGLAAARALRMPHTPSQIASAAVTSVLLVTLAGAAALTATGTNVFDSLFQAASAFGNSGLSTGTLPTVFSPTTYLVLLPLAVLGGLGLPVLIELADRLFTGPPLSKNSRAVIGTSGIVYLLGFVALLLAQAPVASGGGWPAWRSTLASCSVAAINTRTAGIGFQSPAVFTAAGQWLLIALMLVGAASAGTGGGIKITTLWHLCTGTSRALSGRPVHRAAGIALVWAGAYLLALLVGLLLLVSIEPQIPGDRMLFLAVSAMGNVGLSHDPVAITGPGLLVLSLLMLAGRLGSLGVLWWLAESSPGADVLVG